MVKYAELMQIRKCSTLCTMHIRPHNNANVQVSLLKNLKMNKSHVETSKQITYGLTQLVNWLVAFSPYFSKTFKARKSNLKSGAGNLSLFSAMTPVMMETGFRQCRKLTTFWRCVESRLTCQLTNDRKPVANLSSQFLVSRLTSMTVGLSIRAATLECEISATLTSGFTDLAITVQYIDLFPH